jgi:hypothetical protein
MKYKLIDTLLNKTYNFNNKKDVKNHILNYLIFIDVCSDEQITINELENFTLNQLCNNYNYKLNNN